MITMEAAELAAADYNTVVDVGDTAPEWKNLIGTDDKPHSLADLQDRDVVVVVFTCNSCPYAVDAEDRVIALQQEYESKGVVVVAINVNTNEEDRMPAMKQRAAKKEFPFSYLFDESQQIAKDYGAIHTPQFFVLDKDRKIVYMGSLDDSPDGKKVTKHYVRSVIESLLKMERPEISETVPVGCGIRFERERRRRSR
ncbi:thioredoxin family protein [Novipirellula artificiosorum]|nr:thioredoxin family protein [Novipirellula artificiosorum]